MTKPLATQISIFTIIFNSFRTQTDHREKLIEISKWVFLRKQIYSKQEQLKQQYDKISKWVFFRKQI